MDENRLLRRAPNVTIWLREGSPAELQAEGGSVEAGTQVLSILDLFAEAATIDTVLERIAALGQHDPEEGARIIAQLERVGILVDPGSTRSSSKPTGFDAPSAQVDMLDDYARTQGLFRAIREVVRPGDVVVDIGTGTGILAIAAAKAGAARVYAIEQGAIASAAESLIEANEVGHVVKLIRGWSTRVELPERADVLVSEILGADPLDESVLEVFRDARERHLKPGARMVPRGLSIYALPLELPAHYLDRATFSEANVRRWGEAYGLNFAPLSAYSERITRLIGVSSQEASQWQTVAEPCLLTRISFDQDFEVTGTAVGSFRAAHATKRLGLLTYFEVELSPSVSLSTSPTSVSDSNHWGCRVWAFPDKPSVAVGERVEFEYVHDGASVEVRLRAP